MKKFLFFSLSLVLCLFVTRAQEPTFAGFKNINGTNLHFEVYGEGKPLLVVHGGPGLNYDYFLPHLLPLSKKYKLIFYDQRSSGSSAIPADTNTGASYANMIADIEAIRKAFDIDKLNILAHSWGVILAINHALKNSANLGSLILCSSLALSHEFDTAQQSLIKQKWTRDTTLAGKSKQIKAQPGSVSLIRIKLAFLTAFYDVNNLDKLRINLPGNFADAQNVLYRSLMSDATQYDRNYYPELKAIKAPVLIIHGDHDNVPLAASEKAAKSLPGAKLARFDKSGHFPFIEEQDRFVETVSAFLDSIK